ncbi:MAG: hypothetical protein M3Y27_29745 [Acidobacteriota bacterium]|nr:hypothetical protein [Acidobacteriota bacterium]
MSIKRFLGLAVLICIPGVMAKTSHATVIYDNGPPLSYTDRTTVTGWEMTHYVQANNFFLANPSRFEGFLFWDLEQPGYFAGTILWQIYSDNGNGKPGTLLLSGTSRNLSHSSTGFTAFGNFGENVTSFDLGPFSLPRGSYWIALHNGDLSYGMTGTYQDWNFYWEATGSVSGAALPLKKIAPYNGSWLLLINPKNAAFQLSGVASPSQLVVTIIGGTAQISFASTAGFTYRVEYRDALVNSPWTTLPGADSLAGNGNVIQLTDEGSETQAHRYYRVMLPYNGAGIPVISGFSTNGSPQISFTTSAGYFYQVQYKNDLSDLSWASVSGAETIVGTGASISVNDPDPNLGNHSRRFYRAVLQ